jgi:2-polyprenyl-6-methoxyphenol hydroxylase-like FAD-dependent oxidoreductase
VEDGGQVTALFTDGSSAAADLLIGADGLHSAVRRQMHPRSRLRYAGYGMYTGVLDTPHAAGITHMQERWGRGRRFGRFPISAGQISWFVTANLKEGNPPPAQGWKAYLQEHYRDWPAEVRSFIEATPAERIIPKEIYDAAPLRWTNNAGAWYTRRAVLLGDAAHPTTPNMGQGGCQAIESAVLLVRCLGEMDSLPAALRRYQRARWPQASLLTFQSRQIGQAGQFSFPLLCAFRDAAGLLLPDALLGIPFRLIVDHRI